MLKEPRVCACYMLKTPLKLMKKSITTPIFFFLLIVFAYLVLLFFIFPCKSQKNLKAYRLPKFCLAHRRYGARGALFGLLLKRSPDRPWLLKEAQKHNFFGMIAHLTS